MLHEQKFPENTLFCCDAGFTGYEFWQASIDAGHSLLIRGTRQLAQMPPIEIDHLRLPPALA